MSLDISLFHFINGFAGKSGILDWLGIFFGDYLAYILVLAAVYFLFREKNIAKRFYFFGIMAISVILSRGIITEIIRLIWSRSRPFFALGIQPLISEPTGGSFPSGHAAAFFALGFAIYYFYREEIRECFKNPGTWFLAAALIMGIARVFAGVHWPTDILGGAILGWLVAYLTVKYLLPIRRMKSSGV
ncbi:MAG: phosphatase PAP2 family protein [Candidatus Wolfebacteria bacterium]|nr:phosphatase PAP2 family protein [Candidatus Wolfebacteria bacterium]